MYILLIAVNPVSLHHCNIPFSSARLPYLYVPQYSTDFSFICTFSHPFKMFMEWKKWYDSSLICLVNSTLLQVCSSLRGISWQYALCLSVFSNILCFRLVNAEMSLVISCLLTQVFEDRGQCLIDIFLFPLKNIYCIPTVCQALCWMLEPQNRQGKFLH